ncbi:hypothetical protein NEFER03_0832 [Nematocida sp. LUAm3]|nr:hypothetical protein NEFER03_0832 [Nematocida sp. LUAm3]KAI5174850.1 hypothetical protein NEFER02_0950 [Nematocida sp. LUAm2]KAI5177552.1 hypothetical protein NEFER01_0802 [Nematocida sp. LUAm1]
MNMNNKLKTRRQVASSSQQERNVAGRSQKGASVDGTAPLFDGVIMNSKIYEKWLIVVLPFILLIGSSIFTAAAVVLNIDNTTLEETHLIKRVLVLVIMSSSIAMLITAGAALLRNKKKIKSITTIFKIFLYSSSIAIICAITALLLCNKLDAAVILYKGGAFILSSIFMCLGSFIEENGIFVKRNGPSNRTTQGSFWIVFGTLSIFTILAMAVFFAFLHGRSIPKEMFGNGQLQIGWHSMDIIQ